LRDAAAWPELLDRGGTAKGLADLLPTAEGLDAREGLVGLWAFLSETERSVTFDEYQEGMRRTYKPERKPNHALGLAGEIAESADHVDPDDYGQNVRASEAMKGAGRICEAVKKDVYHGKPADRESMRGELGDLLWYVAATAEDYGLSLADIAAANIEKLKRRYPDGFVRGGGIRE
jgi:NTP pyrophosphatase (non-canonical NTP hydrolase)